jgi:hypothetical protein
MLTQVPSQKTKEATAAPSNLPVGQPACLAVMVRDIINLVSICSFNDDISYSFTGGKDARSLVSKGILDPIFSGLPRSIADRYRQCETTSTDYLMIGEMWTHFSAPNHSLRSCITGVWAADGRWWY